jgi:hypothetical protein
MMRRCHGPRNWQLRRQPEKDQVPAIQDNLGAGVESASDCPHGRSNRDWKEWEKTHSHFGTYIARGPL